jgi:transposase-like protein
MLATSCVPASFEPGPTALTLSWLGMGKRSKKASTKAAAAPVSGETLEEKVARLERENAQLRKERDALQMDRAILKKAAAFFAKESE